MVQSVPVNQLAGYVGQEMGVSEWLRIDQDRIDAFADATNDHQFIHVDKERARATPWGTTIAHGFLTLSLLPHFTGDLGIAPEGTVIVLNYGSDRIRFLEPVPVGSELRARVRLVDVADKGGGRYLFRNEVTVEIQGVEKPAMVAETLTMYVVSPPEAA